MARRTRRALLAGLAAATLAALGWMLLAPDAQPAPGDAPRAGADPVAATGPAAAAVEEARAEPPPPSRAEEPALRLRILGGEGELAHGRAGWVTSAEPPWLPPFLVPDVHGWLPAAARTQDVPGETRVDLVRGRWTWLYVRWDGPPLVGRLLRIPPFLGERTLELRAEPGRKVVHAFVVRSDLGGPMPGGEILLHVLGDIPLPVPGAPGPPHRVAVDSSGYARIELAPGHHLLRAPGANARDGAPHTARLHLAPQGFPTELAVVLVQAEPRATLRLVLEAPGGFAPKSPVRAYLERKDDGSGVVVPVPGRVRAGRQEHELRVVPGTYRFATIPVSRCRVAGGREIVEVTPGAVGALVRLAANAPTVTVELNGLSLPQLPVSVFAEPAKGIVEVPTDLLHWGPRTWHRAREDVPPLPEPCRLVVRRRGTYQLSRDVLAPGAASYTVDLEPGTRLEVAWSIDGGVPAAGTVVAETSSGSLVRSLRRELERVGGIVRPALRGGFVVPEGEVTLVGRAGEHSFERTLEARGPFVGVNVGPGRR